MTVEGFSAGAIEFTAGYFPRLPAVIYITGFEQSPNRATNDPHTGNGHLPIKDGV